MKNVPPFRTVSFHGAVAFCFGKIDPPFRLNVPFVTANSPATSTSFVRIVVPPDCVNAVPSATEIPAGK